MRGASERRILKALREGRREAYADVIDAHYASIYRLLLFLTRDGSQAEDMTQEVFASAWAAIQGFRGDASVKTWLRRIAYNLFLDAQRRRKRDEAFAGGLRGSDPELAADPLARIMTDEHLGRMYRAMEDLEGHERAVLLLHYLDGLSYREMARVLHRTAGTLKWVDPPGFGETTAASHWKGRAMNADANKEQDGMSLEWVKEQLRALSAVEPPRGLKEKLLTGVPCRSGGERVCEKPVQCGMGFQPMNHRQDADATRPHGQDARAASHAPSGALPKHLRWWLGTTGWVGIAAAIVVLCGVLWLWTPARPSVGPEPDAYSALGLVLAVDYNNSLEQMLAADYNSLRPPDINALDSNSLQ